MSASQSPDISCEFDPGDTPHARQRPLASPAGASLDKL